MARPREFDEHQALLEAMRVFWRKGYDATSIPDLLDATGLSRSSLYETWGDKQALFEAAVQLYFRDVASRPVHCLRDGDSVRAALTAFFEAQLASFRSRRNPSGCLMINTATSLESQDPRIRAMVADAIDSLRREFLDVLRRGQARGEIDAARDIEALSHMLTGVSCGLNVVARVTRDQGVLRAMAQSAVDAVA